ncbi:ATP-binding protein [Bradyrhizobium sp. PUT101]|uniref:ATP-binding protein n=1 Tax=Bradyrhizobium sp. PUT101 TaxID=3447427 RepID=UPI003F856EEC
MPDRDDRAHRTFLFGPFRLSTSKRILFEGDRDVRLGAKAIEILIALVERAGELVSKRELLEIAWPDTVVIEANLTVQVAALRRTLGEDDNANPYIVNSPGRGYRFVAPIKVLDEPGQREPSALAANHNLPAQLNRLIGRDEAVQTLRRKLADDRLVSIIGSAGVGKTALALQLAETMLPQFEHGVWLVELASITDPSLIWSVIASALPIEVRSNDALSGVVSAVRSKNVLLVFDNCEHLIEGAAVAISTILLAADRTKVLITSREPLRINGEQVVSLPPLSVPPPQADLGLKDALAYPALQLFVERAAAVTGDFELDDTTAADAAQVCTRLDGNPLAIEIAAARVSAFGVKGLAGILKNRLSLLEDARRGTPARHRTIAAAIDWSYQLLSEREQLVFRCLGIFAGSFSLEAAVAIVPPGDHDTALIVADLVCKSLLSVDVGDNGTRFRLPEIVRAFALGKLIDQSEHDMLAVNLASCVTAMLRKCADGPNRVQMARDAVKELDNVRGVLDWAFARDGEKSAGVALAVAAVPVWLENSLLTECIAWTSKAVDRLDPTAECERDEMILKAALGLAMMYTEGMTGRTREALNRAIEIAVGLEDHKWELRVRLALALFLHRRGDLKAARAEIERMDRLVSDIDEPIAVAMVKSVKSEALYFSARYPAAFELAVQAHSYFQTHPDTSTIGRWGVNHSINAQCVMASVDWCEGRLDRARRTSLAAQAAAERTGHPTAICQALVWCCTIYLRMEELDLAEAAILRLRQLAEANNIQSYVFSAMAFEGRLLFLRREFERSEQLLRKGIINLSDARYDNARVPFLGRLAELLAATGRPEEAVLASTESLDRTRAIDALGMLPDALRIHGTALQALEGSQSRAAESYFREAIAMSRQQGALGWELKAAECLADMLRLRGRIEEASTLLGQTLGLFLEGQATPPFRRAKHILEGLQGAVSEEASDPAVRALDPGGMDGLSRR